MTLRGLLLNSCTQCTEILFLTVKYTYFKQKSVFKIHVYLALVFLELIIELH